MLMNLFDKLRWRFFGADPDAVAAYRTVLPSHIYVSIKKDGDCLIARINKVDERKIKGLLITEAKDMATLISTVNDLIYTYVKMPSNIRPYYGDVFAPENYKKDAKELVLVKA